MNLESILLGAFIVFFANYLVSYFTEKGKNKAIKSDIKEINQRIEEVKTEVIKQQSYLSEKGKNRANLEDQAEIVNVIKSVESNFNESLERFRINLQRQHAFSKSIIELCNNLDKELIDKLIGCREAFSLDGSYNVQGRYGNAMNKIIDLGRFLKSYSVRYGKIEGVDILEKKCIEMEGVSIHLEEGYKRGIVETNYYSIASKVDEYAEDLLKKLLPEFDI